VLYRAPFDPIYYDSAVLQHSWFNILELPDREGNRDIKKQKIDEHNKAIHREIKDQYNIIGDYKNIFIGGFSQSACLALYSCMSYKENLGGVIMFSGFNFDFTPIDSEKSKIPVLAVNGLSDETVIIRHARNSFYRLKKNKFNLNLVEETGLYHAFSKSGLRAANDLLRDKNFV